MSFYGVIVCNRCGYNGIYANTRLDIDDYFICPICGEHYIFPDIDPVAFIDMPSDQKEEYLKALRNNAELEPSLVAKRIAYEAEQSVKSSVPSTPKPKCPTCSSTNVHKISAGERVASVGLFGLFSKKINKTFKCKDCGYSW